MKKRILSVLLALCLVLSLAPMTALAEDAPGAAVWDGTVATAFAGGTGTEEDPYQIADGAQLAYLASSVNGGETYEGKSFVLTADIDLNGLPWTPIANTFAAALLGGSDCRVFAGDLDGRGHTVSNVAIGSESAPLESDVFGFFGGTEGKISNLNLDNVSIYGLVKTTDGYVIGLAGGLAGSVVGPVENCHVSNLTMNMALPDTNYAAAYWIGGFVGALDGKQVITECSVSGSIEEQAGKGSIGGFIGELGEEAKITYSRADVALNVKADAYGGADVGGFIGKGNGSSNAETVIRNCYASGNVRGGAYSGGFTGSIWGLNIKNCYAAGDVTQAAASMASFAGTDGPAGYAYGSVINCYASGEVIGKAAYRYAFAMQDAAKRSEITNCYFADVNSEIKNENESAEAKSPDEMKTEAFAAALNAGDDGNGWSFMDGRVLCGAEPADYGAVESALAAVPSDLTPYSDESLAALNAALAGVIRGKAVVHQAQVDAMAKAIEDAIAALAYKSADYTRVDEAIAKANALTKEDYEDFSAVEAAVGAVVRGKDFTQQDEVDAMAKAIEDAIAALVPKETDHTKTCPSAKFTDVNTNEWYHEAVDYAVENGLFAGTSDTTFTPGGSMTRGMLVTVLWRMAGRPEAKAPAAFRDVDAGQYYAEAVAWAAENGVVAGISETAFAPNAKATREQLAAILYRYAKWSGVDVTKTADLASFPDAGKVSAYAEEPLAWAVANGIVSGTLRGGKAYLDPQGSATRAQTASMLMRYARAFA